MRTPTAYAVLFAALLGLALGPWPAGAQQAARDIPLPSGVRPFDGTISLRYGRFERFSYTFRADILVGDQPRGIAEGWVMEGTMARRGDGLDWSYRMSNIGRDEQLRYRGALEVGTDRWGRVHTARLIEDRWPPRGEHWSSADFYFNPARLRFPLCCCPSDPVRMGASLEFPAELETMPLPGRLPLAQLPEEARRGMPPAFLRAERHVEAVVAGVMDRNGRRLLVVRHHGGIEGADLPADAPRFLVSGYTAIDTRTCMPVETRWATEIFSATADGPKTMTVLHTIRSRF